MTRSAISVMWLSLLFACGQAQVVIPARLTALDGETSLSSYELWALDQLGRDGTAVECADLLQLRVLPTSENIVALADPVRGDFSDGVSVSVKGLRSGARSALFYAAVYSQSGQLGTRTASGCVAGKEIRGGETAAIVIEVSLTRTP